MSTYVSKSETKFIIMECDKETDQSTFPIFEFKINLIHLVR